MTIAQIETLSNQFPELRQLVGEIIKYLNDNPPGGGGVTLYTGDGTLAGDRVVDLDGHFLDFTQNGNRWAEIDPVGNLVSFGPFIDFDDGNEAKWSGTASDEFAQFDIHAEFNDEVKQVQILGFADATTSTLEYTADTHKFNGISEFADNAAALLGGLEAGMLYYTDVAGDGILKIVI